MCRPQNARQVQAKNRPNFRSRSPDLSRGRSVTRARRLYVNRPANFHSNDLRQTAHIYVPSPECAPSQEPSPICTPEPPYTTSIDGAHARYSHQPPVPLSSIVLSFYRPSFPRPQPGTQCDTSATSLRKQTSKLPFKRPTLDTGQCTRMCTATNRAKDGEFGGYPAPHSRSLNG